MSPTAAPAVRRAASLPPDERRSAIVASTLPLLVAHGEMVTTRQIADAAGIAEGTIFRVFADKDAVITAAVEAALDTAPLEEHLRAIDASLSFEASLVAAVEILQQRVVDIWRLVSSIGPRFHNQTKRPVVDLDALVDLFKANRTKLWVEPLVAARHLRTLTLSATHPMMVGEPMAPADIIELFLHGVSRATKGKGR
ncbi:MAG: TetR family transcriptional regulator [Actinobacteria bacterium]|nr:TetR family transcriptional regulator [Actinomycetota bacterium]